MLSVRVNSEPWIIQCNALSRALRIDVPEVLRTQAMLFTGQIMRFTPPTRGRPAATGAKDKRQPSDVGAGAVFGDLRRAMTPADPEMENAPEFIKNNPRVRDMVLSGDKAGFAAVLAKIPGFAGWRIEEFSAGLHYGAQNSKGRVRKGQKIFVIGASIGRWWFHAHKSMEHVGRLKAGWLPAFRALGGKTGLVPDWVQRHASGARGRVEINLTGDHPTILVGNSAMGVAQLEKLTEDTFKKRIGVMKRQMQKVMEGYVLDHKSGQMIKPKAAKLPKEAV